jgi:hypothetical protein
MEDFGLRQILGKNHEILTGKINESKKGWGIVLMVELLP